MGNLLLLALYYYCFFTALWFISFVLPTPIIHGYAFIASAFLSIIVGWWIFRLVLKLLRRKRVVPTNKAVIITGCDSGFGHDLAKRLDSKGFLVFASCLFPEGEGARELKASCSSRLHVLGLDVTKDESVKSAVEYVQRNLDNFELWAVVNNAGVMTGFAVSWTKLDYFQKCLDVNTMGPIRVTKAFLPLLRRSKGRVVTVASNAGRIALPFSIPYTISKFATIGFIECLRLEMQQWGIRVISIEPEAFNTGLTKLDNIMKDFEDVLQNIDEDTMKEYGEGYFQRFQLFMKSSSSVSSEKTYLVVNCLEDAVSLEQPNDVYQPCRNTFVALIYYVFQNLPRPLQEMIVNTAMHYFGPEK